MLRLVPRGGRMLRSNFAAAFCSVSKPLKSHTQLSTAERSKLLSEIPAHGSAGSMDQFYVIEREIRALHEDVKMYLAHSDMQGALEAAQECSRVSAAHFGQNHVVFASSLNNMALVYKESGQTTQALNYYEEALKVYEETAGADHPSTIAVLANTGLLYARMAETTRGVERLTVLDTAHDYIERALELRKEAFFEEAPIVSVTMTHLGNVKRLQKAFPAAEKLYETAIARLADKPGTEHRAYGDAQNGYGLLLKDQGKFEAALQAYGTALEVRTAAVGETHPDVLVTKYNISECLIASGDVDSGTAMQRSILQSVGVDPEAVTEEELEGQALPGGLVVKNGQIVAPADEGVGPLPATPAERDADKAAAALGEAPANKNTTQNTPRQPRTRGRARGASR